MLLLTSVTVPHCQALLLCYQGVGRSAAVAPVYHRQEEAGVRGRRRPEDDDGEAPPAHGNGLHAPLVNEPPRVRTPRVGARRARASARLPWGYHGDLSIVKCDMRMVRVNLAHMHHTFK